MRMLWGRWVYEALAGCWYGGERGLDEELFQTAKVEEWVGALVGGFR
jgi:hypothetical protein